MTIDEILKEFRDNFIIELKGELIFGRKKPFKSFENWLKHKLVNDFKAVLIAISGNEFGYHLCDRLVEGWLDKLRLGVDVNHNIAEVRKELKELERE